jgi:hypothetical protein
MSWELSPAETLYAFDRIGWDRIPAPLAVHPDVASQDDWEAIERELRLRFPVLEDPDLLPVLQTAVDPDMSLVMIGARKKPLRAYGAVTTNIGVTMVQRPGPDAESGGNIVIEVGSPAVVPKVFAAVAGKQPAGQHRSMVETWERVRDERPVAGLVSDEPALADRIRDLLAAPRTGRGHIEVRIDRHSARPHPPRYISWFDVAGDGRYTYTRSYGDFHIDPCGTTELEQAIGQLMELDL